MSEGIKKITDKILKDARTEAKKIKGEYQKQVKEIEEKYQKKVDELKAREQKRINEMALGLKERKLSQEEIRLRLEFLNHRYGLLDDLINKAVAGLPKSKGYFKFLTDILQNSGWKDGEVILSEEDQNKFGDKLIKWADKNGFSFKIVDHDLDIGGGLIIKKGKEAINASISTIVDELREELLVRIEPEVATGEEI